jgi:hypothetical protein
MLPANLTNALKVLARTDKPLITSDTVAPVGKLATGQQLQGTVLAQLKSGSFNVSVASETVQMRLPAQIRSGDIVNLRVISTTPQLTLSFLASTPTSRSARPRVCWRISPTCPVDAPRCNN